MVSKKTVWLVAICAMALAGCSQEERKSVPTTQQTTAGSVATETSKEQAAGEVYEGTITGVISDSMCGKDHSGMGELGKDPAACTKKCVVQGAKYVLVDDKGNAYSLSDQEKPADFAGKTVSIEGHIDPTGKAIHVHSLTAS